MQSLVHIENGILQQLTGQGNEDWGKKKEESGKCGPPGTKQQFIQPAC